MSTLSITDAKNKRKIIKAMTTQIRNCLDSSDPTQLSRFDLSERMKKLSALWEQYDEVQTRIETLDVANIGDIEDPTLLESYN